MLENIVVVAGLTSVALMWVFCTVAALHVVWDTVGEHALGVIEKLRRRKG